MASTLEATLKLSISASMRGALDLSGSLASLREVYLQAFADGAGANAAEEIFADERTVAASGNEDIDLAGSLTNILGEAVVFTAIKAIIIKADPGNTNAVQVTRPASNGVPLFMAAGDGISLAPGEVFSWFSGSAAGKVVTADSGDLLNIANSSSGTGVTYKIIVIGITS